MKCPKCGKWNQATMPHCIYCGEPLEPDDGFYSATSPSWEDQLKDSDKPRTFVLVDETGTAEKTHDPRDTLANEMVELEKRKREGEERQRKLRAEAAQRGYAPSGRTVRTTSNRSTFFSVEDNPDATLRPVAPELVEEGDVDPTAKRVYSVSYRYKAMPQQGETRRSNHVYTSVQQSSADPYDDQPVYDGFHDTSSYIPDYQRADDTENTMRLRNTESWKPRRLGLRRLLRLLVILSVAALVGWIGWKIVWPMIESGRNTVKAVATVTPTIRNDLAAHTITIPGDDGQRISIRELRTSAIVTSGVATFDILDHIWYDDYEQYLQDTMTVTLSPYLITDSGKQQPLEQITYDIDIPLSPIELLTPDNPYKEVSTAMYTISFYVSEGSIVSINGEDYSDLVNTEGGKVSYNATVQPIGENKYTISVRSQYCRENTMEITLYREKQDIPLDLSSDIYSTSSDPVMTVRATTMPGAVVRVLSPYSDLDITKTASEGTFTFKALFDHIGTNTITITADYPGKKTTVVNYEVYYVPSIDAYSRKAWDIVGQYTDLMDNLELRKKHTQIYVCIGKILSIETTKPQRAFMECSTAEGSVTIYIENQTKTTWEEGVAYRLYADAFGMYDSKPWLVARYTYDP